MWIVAVRDDFLGVNVHVLITVEVEFDGNIGRKVEVRVQGASTMTRFDGCSSREFVNIVCTCRRAVQTFLDAVALGLDLGKREINFGDDPGYVEAARIWKPISDSCSTSPTEPPTSNASMVLGLEPRANGLKPSPLTPAGGCGRTKGCDGQVRDNENSIRIHLGLFSLAFGGIEVEEGRL
jgi:hypothetical protein